MNKQAILFGLAILFVLAACTPTVPVGENETATFNETDYSPETPVNGEEIVEPVENNEYAATVRGVEGDFIQLNTRAVDPDGDEVTLYFGEPFSTEGTWQTDIGDAGEYDVRIIASDGIENTSITILVVVDALNLPPSIRGPEVIEVREGEVVDLNIYNITDPEGDDIIVSYSGWMSSATYRTTYDDAGEYNVRIIAEDTAGNEVFKDVTVIVENVNRPPVLELAQTSIQAVEGDRINLRANATDPDGSEVTITYTEPVGTDGIWQSRVGDAGEYVITVTASDGIDEVSQEVTVELAIRNRPPVIIVEDEIVINEGEHFDLKNWVTISDPDGDEVVVRYSGWMNTSTRYVDFGEAGEYVVEIEASDRVLTTTKEVLITVQAVNRPPVFVVPA
ncbi:MAG: hypothetical protein ACMXYD_01890 [Candidatus Woesearchaeota archaeon]